METGQFICPFCDAPYTEDMLKAMDGSYGCDTGCEFMRVIIECGSCHRAVYVWGTFGGTDRTPWKLSEGATTPLDIAEALANSDLYEDDPDVPTGRW